MNRSIESYVLRVMRGKQRGAVAASLRAALAVAEPLYSGLMAVRNGLYDRGVKRSHRLARPVISVGNITTGGTGKTPVVMWLAERLRRENFHLAILLRFNDEATLLDRRLNVDASIPVRIQPDPDRAGSAARISKSHPDVNVFLLDDAFQHRRVQRDFDLVLIDATNPFGFDHVLPRGLLREPLRGLVRADAFLITRSADVSPDAVAEIERRLKQLTPEVEIFHADHSMEPPTVGKRIFAFCGIGNPHSFIRGLGPGVIGHCTFPDHHDYSFKDVIALCDQAARLNADEMLTTEKDWVKLERLRLPPGGPPIRAVRMEIEFRNDDEARLFDRILRAIRTTGLPRCG